MKGKVYQQGTKIWRAYLRDAFESYMDFEALSFMYGLHEHLGYSSPALAWEDNPYIEGSDTKQDFKRINGP